MTIRSRFDALAKVSNYLSLNVYLKMGFFTIYRKFSLILIRFPSIKFGVISDIIQLFLDATLHEKKFLKNSLRDDKDKVFQTCTLYFSMIRITEFSSLQLFIIICLLNKNIIFCRIHEIIGQ